MKTQIRPGNPFGHNRYGFLWEALSDHASGRHLDYGTHDGSVLRALLETGQISEGVGIDVNIDKVVASRSNMPGKVQLMHVSPSRFRRGYAQVLPFADASFDSASLLDVIEHVHDQEGLLGEIKRVLKPGGRLVVTVPKRHAFSFLDLGNFKFAFPEAHRVYYSLRYSPEAYRSRYIECPNGLIGDIEIEKSWHEHFSQDELRALLQRCGFRVLSFDGSGLFMRPMILLKLFPLGQTVRNAISWLRNRDSEFFDSANLFCTACHED